MTKSGITCGHSGEIQENCDLGRKPGEANEMKIGRVFSDLEGRIMGAGGLLPTRVGKRRRQESVIMSAEQKKKSSTPSSSTSENKCLNAGECFFSH